MNIECDNFTIQVMSENDMAPNVGCQMPCEHPGMREHYLNWLYTRCHHTSCAEASESQWNCGLCISAPRYVEGMNSQ
jgi:hypothetical protein